MSDYSDYGNAFINTASSSGGGSSSTLIYNDDQQGGHACIIPQNFGTRGFDHENYNCNNELDLNENYGRRINIEIPPGETIYPDGR